MSLEKALDALAPFVALSKSANSPRYASDLIVRAISHPDTYVFAELLYKPQIESLATAAPEYAAHLTLLQIFSYGTYADYKRGTAPSTAPTQTPQPRRRTTQQPQQPPATGSPRQPLPPLTEAAANKLRQLSLLSLATDRASLSYDYLVQALHLRADADDAAKKADKDAEEAEAHADADADAALESLVIAAIYAGLLQATLDPARRVVRISAVAPLRDPAPGLATLSAMHLVLNTWSTRCEATLADLDAQVAGIRKAAAERAAERARWQSRVDKAIETDRKMRGGMKVPGPVKAGSRGL